MREQAAHNRPPTFALILPLSYNSKIYLSNKRINQIGCFTMLSEIIITTLAERVVNFLVDESRSQARGWFKLDQRDPQQEAFKNAFRNAMLLAI